MRGWIDSDGYHRVTIVSKGRKRQPGVHQLVALAFIGERPSKRHQTAHGNGRRSDNKLKNLRWATPLQNQRDRLRHGTHNRGERHPNAKLTRKQVAFIRKNYLPRHQVYGAKALASRFHVTRGAIDGIVNKKGWR